MKRFFLVLGILFFLGISPVGSLAAETPMPTRSVQLIPTPVDAGALNELLDNSESFSIGDTANSTSITIKNVNLEAGADFKVPKMEDIANFFATGAAYLSPFTIKQTTINQEENLYISGRATYHKTNSNNTPISVNSDTAYTTEILPELSVLDQASRFVAAITSRYSFSDFNGVYDYNHDRGPLELASITIDELSGSGATQQEKLVQTIGAFFENKGGILEILKSIFGTSGIIKAKLASKQLTPYSESMDCLITGCSANGDLTYLSQEEQKKVKDNGGIVKTYASIYHKITTGDPNGQEENNFSGLTIKTNSLGTKAIENATNYMKCAILPKFAQEKFGLADKCTPEVTTPTTCNINSLPTFTIKSECKIKKNTFGLSEKLIETIEAAASAYNVPAALMLGVMYGEGAFNPNTLFKTAGVDQYLDGCSILPNCDVNASIINNIVPYFKVNWVDVENAVKIIDPNRTPNACNLTDGIFSLAETLHRFQYAPAFAGKTCFGIPLVSTVSKTAQTCTTWKDENIESAIRFWEFGNGWNETTTSCATKLNSCFTGGGLASQCPTGGDTCDKVQTPYSQPSHNACIWNAYKAN